MSRAVRQVIVRGHVQGVGYRAWVATTAQAQGLEGWVRNRRDGSVEALLAGVSATVTEVIAACYHGPSAARVDGVFAEDAGPDALDQRNPGERFSILATV
ncbi:Acylphosphatase [Rhodopseudomonas palustris HaA2]|uniref:acylphosphatase n=1 Tax=Rhodopseudomonas palustris (strain HaA2) TaxID=316058 RepID=Q2IXI6_RHOP2|nr:acylphosphatase [Rhodopseudomonas palustris]ABD07074.1 Acylphosphatase [Rhodopseudomonas palustris HaA2]